MTFFFNVLRCTLRILAFFCAMCEKNLSELISSVKWEYLWGCIFFEVRQGLCVLCFWCRGEKGHEFESWHKAITANCLCTAKKRNHLPDNTHLGTQNKVSGFFQTSYQNFTALSRVSITGKLYCHIRRVNAQGNIPLIVEGR